MSHPDSYQQGFPSWLEHMSPDYPASKKFYSALFGWAYSEQQVGPDAERDIYGLITSDGAEIGGMGYQRPDQIEAGEQPMWFVAFDVDNADATTKAIAENGGTVLLEPMDVFGQGRYAMALDPTNAVFTIWEAGTRKGADAFQEPNTLLWVELETPNPGKAAQFYERVFGIEANVGESQGESYTYLGRGESRYGGILQMDDKSRPPRWHPYFCVMDLDATVEKAETLGAKQCKEIFTIPFGRIASMVDPQGAPFTMMTPVPPAQ